MKCSCGADFETQKLLEEHLDYMAQWDDEERHHETHN